MQSSLYEQWVKSVTPSYEEIEHASGQGSPYGEPSSHVGYINDISAFEKRLSQDKPTSPATDTVIKYPGSYDIKILEGYEENMAEAIEIILEDQLETEPLFKHAEMQFTFTQNIVPLSTSARIIHVDPERKISAIEGINVRNAEAVQENSIFFLSNKQGTLIQSQYIIKPEDNLNRMTPEGIADLGFLRASEPFEVRKGTQNTYHTQGAETYDSNRTFCRIIIAYPPVEYFHDLPDEEKSELPVEFRQQHGIVFSDRIPHLAQ